MEFLPNHHYYQITMEEKKKWANQHLREDQKRKSYEKVDWQAIFQYGTQVLASDSLN